MVVYRECHSRYTIILKNKIFIIKFNANTTIFKNTSHSLAKSNVIGEVLRHCVAGAADRMVRA